MLRKYRSHYNILLAETYKEFKNLKIKAEQSYPKPGKQSKISGFIALFYTFSMCF